MSLIKHVGLAHEEATVATVSPLAQAEELVSAVFHSMPRILVQ